MNALRRFLAYALPTLAIAGVANAVPIQWSGNGHYYEVISSGEIGWLTAYQSATGRLHLGLPGYLATVTSSGEQAFVQSILPTGFQYWLGGYQAAGGAEPGGGWTWATSESWGTYLNWDTGQPDDNGTGNPGGEDFLAMFSNAPGHPVGSWNDEDNPGCALHGPIAGYIVEYGDVTGSHGTLQGACSPAAPQCSDGLDNDGDGCADHPCDSGCSSASDNSEAGGPCCSALEVPNASPQLIALLVILLCGAGALFLRRRPQPR